MGVSAREVIFTSILQCMRAHWLLLIVLKSAHGDSTAVLRVLSGRATAVLRMFSGCAHTRGRYHALRRSQLQDSAGRTQGSSEHSQAGVRGRETGVWVLDARARGRLAATVRLAVREVGLCDGGW